MVKISTKILKFHFTRENVLVHKVVIHFDVLCPSVENKVLRQLDTPKVVVVDHHRISNLHQQIL